VIVPGEKPAQEADSKIEALAGRYGRDELGQVYGLCVAVS